MFSTMRKMLFKGQSNLPVNVSLPHLEISEEGVSASPKQLQAYRQMFGLVDNGVIPLPFLFLLSHTTQLAFLTHEQWPLKILGMVHKSNEFELLSPIHDADSVDIKVSFVAEKFVKVGREITVDTTFTCQGDVKAIMRGVYVSRGPSTVTEKSGERRQLLEQATSTGLISIDYPERIGRDYAKVSKDYNPIHLYKMAAKLFGFKQHVAHGMYSAGQIYSQLAGHTAHQPHTFTITFLTPVFLPSQGKLLSKTEANVTSFTLWSTLFDRPFAEGHVLTNLND